MDLVLIKVRPDISNYRILKQVSRKYYDVCIPISYHKQFYERVDDGPYYIDYVELSYRDDHDFTEKYSLTNEKNEEFESFINDTLYNTDSSFYISQSTLDISNDYLLLLNKKGWESFDLKTGRWIAYIVYPEDSKMIVLRYAMYR